jgi:Malonate decarboxylase, alpha subunit, transporter
MGSDVHGRRHPTAAWLKAGREASDTESTLIRGRKLVVQILETFGEKMKPNFVETLDSVAIAEELKFDLAPVMIYGDDVSHIVTEEGIANLLLCRGPAEREQAIRGVAGFTDVGRARDRKTVEALRQRGVIRRFRRSRHRSLVCDPPAARGPFDRGSRDLVRWPLPTAVQVPELVAGEGGTVSGARHDEEPSRWRAPSGHHGRERLRQS